MEERPPTTFGEYAYELRSAEGWTLREAASQIGIAHSRLTEIESGIDGHTGKAFTPAYMIVVQMAKAYGVQSADMLRLAGHEPLAELEPDEKEVMLAYRALDAVEKAEVRAFVSQLIKRGRSI